MFAVLFLYYYFFLFWRKEKAGHTFLNESIFFLPLGFWFQISYFSLVTQKTSMSMCLAGNFVRWSKHWNFSPPPKKLNKTMQRHCGCDVPPDQSLDNMTPWKPSNIHRPASSLKVSLAEKETWNECVKFFCVINVSCKKCRGGAWVRAWQRQRAPAGINQIPLSVMWLALIAAGPGRGEPRIQEGWVGGWGVVKGVRCGIFKCEFWERKREFWGMVPKFHSFAVWDLKIQAYMEAPKTQRRLWEPSQISREFDGEMGSSHTTKGSCKIWKLRSFLESVLICPRETGVREHLTPPSGREIQGKDTGSHILTCWGKPSFNLKGISRANLTHIADWDTKNCHNFT